MINKWVHIGTGTSCSRTVDTNDAFVLLYRVSSSGSYTTTTLHHYASEAVGIGAVGYPTPLPDDQGGVLVRWTCNYSCCASSRPAAYVNEAGVSTEFTIDVLPSIAGSNHVAYGLDNNGGGSLAAIDMTTGAVLWNAAAMKAPVAALLGGSVAAKDNSGGISI